MHFERLISVYKTAIKHVMLTRQQMCNSNNTRSNKNKTYVKSMAESYVDTILSIFFNYTTPKTKFKLEKQNSKYNPKIQNSKLLSLSLSLLITVLLSQY